MRPRRSFLGEGLRGSDKKEEEELMGGARRGYILYYVRLEACRAEEKRKYIDLSGKVLKFCNRTWYIIGFRRGYWCRQFVIY